VIVIDASALVAILLQTSRSAPLLRVIGSERMVAPDLINVEVLSALRRLTRDGTVSAARADQAAEDLRQSPISRFPTLPLLQGTWRLRAHLSMYDACYVSLAEALGCQLLTTDARLARAPGLSVQVLTP
jgi:predicted nucleic acid-binding protein